MPSSTALYRNKLALKDRLKEIPNSAGIYRFFDVNGGLIYVGKSIRLRERVRSYFSGKADCKKVRRLRQEISSLDWQETGSELEALLLESRLVKRNQPRFNVMLKEFVPLPYVRIDLRDPFPMLEVTRAPARDGATYFGPYRSRSALEAGVGALTDALRMRTCDTPGWAITARRPCYRHEFGTCSAPCLGLVTESDYQASSAQAAEVFEGRAEPVLNLIRARMERAAERMQFEIAARLRDAVRHIESVSGKQHALRSAVSNLSLVAACPSRHSDHLCLFVFRSGKLAAHQEVSRADLRSNAREWAERMVVAWADAPEPDRERLVSADLDEIQIVTYWMRQRTDEGTHWAFPPSPFGPEILDGLTEWLLDQASPHAVLVKRAA